jgi:hypothetical protein
MKRFIVAMMVSACVACDPGTGPQGERGPEGQEGPEGRSGPPGDAGTPGGGHYTSKQSVYCKEATGTTMAAGYALAVDCNDANDLYLTGGCDRVSEPNSFLYENSATGLDRNASSLVEAGHRCAWAFNPTTGPSALPAARARLCCIEVQ